MKNLRQSLQTTLNLNKAHLYFIEADIYYNLIKDLFKLRNTSKELHNYIKDLFVKYRDSNKQILEVDNNG